MGCSRPETGIQRDPALMEERLRLAVALAARVEQKA
jgi:hypothetical protein